MEIIFAVQLAASLVFRAKSMESHWQCQVTMLVPQVVLALLRPPRPVPGQEGEGLGDVCPFILVPILLEWPGSGPAVGTGDSALTAACPCPELAMASFDVTEQPLSGSIL